MADIPYRCALIIGAGPGISASLARRLSKIGLQVGLAARDVEKLKPLAEETAAAVFAVDASQPEQVAKLFLDMERRVKEPDVVIYNASSRVPGPLSSVDPAAVEKSIAITTFGAFLAAQQAAKRMEPKGRGAIFFTGASAGMKGFRPIGGLRDGQVRTARARSERCKRARPEGDTRRALQHRRRRPLAAPTRPERSARQHARSRRNRPDLYRRPCPAEKRLVARNRPSAVDRTILGVAATAPQVHFCQ